MNKKDKEKLRQVKETVRNDTVRKYKKDIDDWKSLIVEVNKEVFELREKNRKLISEIERLKEENKEFLTLIKLLNQDREDVDILGEIKNLKSLSEILKIYENIAQHTYVSKAKDWLVGDSINTIHPLSEEEY